MADNPDELTFSEGDVIIVDGEEDQEWWVSRGARARDVPARGGAESLPTWPVRPAPRSDPLAVHPRDCWPCCPSDISSTDTHFRVGLTYPLGGLRFSHIRVQAGNLGCSFQSTSGSEVRL